MIYKILLFLLLIIFPLQTTLGSSFCCMMEKIETYDAKKEKPCHDKRDRENKYSMCMNCIYCAGTFFVIPKFSEISDYEKNNIIILTALNFKNLDSGYLFKPPKVLS